MKFQSIFLVVFFLATFSAFSSVSAIPYPKPNPGLFGFEPGQTLLAVIDTSKDFAHGGVDLLHKGTTGLTDAFGVTAPKPAVPAVPAANGNANPVAAVQGAAQQVAAAVPDLPQGNAAPIVQPPS